MTMEHAIVGRIVKWWENLLTIFLILTLCRVLHAITFYFFGAFIVTSVNHKEHKTTICTHNKIILRDHDILY